MPALEDPSFSKTVSMRSTGGCESVQVTSKQA